MDIISGDTSSSQRIHTIEIAESLVYNEILRMTPGLEQEVIASIHLFSDESCRPILTPTVQEQSRCALGMKNLPHRPATVIASQLGSRVESSSIELSIESYCRESQHFINIVLLSFVQCLKKLCGLPQFTHEMSSRECVDLDDQ